jgi:hypothetical protein
MYERTLKLTAPQDRALYLWFEPWAEGWAFPPGSAIELRAQSDVRGELEVEETVERTAIYAWPGSTLRALANGAEVISFDLPVPPGLTRDKVEMLFGEAPSPTVEEGLNVASRPWWKFW